MHNWCAFAAFRNTHKHTQTFMWQVKRHFKNYPNKDQALVSTRVKG